MSFKEIVDMKETLRWSVEELEQLTAAQLAELLTNIVLLLRRFPQNVPLVDLMPVERQDKEE